MNVALSAVFVCSFDIASLAIARLAVCRSSVAGLFLYSRDTFRPRSRFLVLRKQLTVRRHQKDIWRVVVFCIDCIHVHVLWCVVAFCLCLLVAGRRWCGLRVGPLGPVPSSARRDRHCVRRRRLRRRPCELCVGAGGCWVGGGDGVTPLVRHLSCGWRWPLWPLRSASVAGTSGPHSSPPIRYSSSFHLKPARSPTRVTMTIHLSKHTLHSKCAVEP